MLPNMIDTAETIRRFLLIRARTRGVNHLVAAHLAEYMRISSAAVIKVLGGEPMPPGWLDAIADFYRMDVVDLIRLARDEVAQYGDTIKDELIKQAVKYTRDTDRLRLLDFQVPLENGDDDDPH